MIKGTKLTRIRKNSPRLTSEELLNKLREFKERNGREPFMQDTLDNPSIPSHSTYRHHFGSWKRGKILAFRDALVNSRGIAKELIANDGHTCLSSLEFDLDNLLYHKEIVHGRNIPYPIPFHHPPGTFLKGKRNQKTADFYLPTTELYIETVSGKFNEINYRGYSDRLQEKRNFCREHELNFLIITPEDFSELQEFARYVGTDPILGYLQNLSFQKQQSS